MCTVIVSVPDGPDGTTRMIAVRDEDPARPWDGPGAWWPETDPGVVGIRDRRAGGAWLAADPGAPRAAVLLNRLEQTGTTPADPVSRGAVALDAIAGRALPPHPPMRGFNLVDVSPEGTSVTSWDGVVLRTTRLDPGVHMVAHDDPDDPSSARIARWLPEFRAAGVPDEQDTPWWGPWVDVLRRSSTLPGDDARAIIRDQTFAGVVSRSLLLCAVSLDAEGLRLAHQPLVVPGRWSEPDWV